MPYPAHVSDAAYCYDGSYAGFLCCIFESYTRREIPSAVLGPAEGQITLFGTEAIATDPTPPATVKVPPAAAPRRREERERVAERFSSTAKSIRDAAKRIRMCADIKPAQVTALRTKLQDMLAELDQLQQGGVE